MCKKEDFKDKMELVFESRSENEAFARVAVAAFVTRLDPTLEELDDMKTAVSEAVTNAIIHGYQGQAGNRVYISCEVKEEKRMMTVTIRDEGVGIADIEQAKEPLYTTRPEMDRSGMGFVFMEVFMDSLQVESRPGEGTTIRMSKQFRKVIEE